MEGRSHLFSNVYPNVVSDLATLDLEEEELPEEGAEGGDICTDNDGEEKPLLSALKEWKREVETEQRTSPSATWKTPATPRTQEPAAASNPNQLLSWPMDHLDANRKRLGIYGFMPDHNEGNGGRGSGPLTLDYYRDIDSV